ncbi:MAG TPA: MEDS domain-containing protein [Thermoanaerobaculia bacterium]|nr:MEDS domain-containing protein [Thermoanaerobaculia bacterium]
MEPRGAASYRGGSGEPAWSNGSASRRVHGDLERRVARLRHGDHLCLIYDAVQEQTAALVAFVKGGLAAGDRCLFVGHPVSGSRLERALAEAGVRAGREAERGALVLLSDREMWLPAGRFEPGAVMDLLRQAEQQALDDGFSGLRASWDLGWVLEGIPGSEQLAPPLTDRLVELEAHLNRFLSGSRTAALCRYPRRHSPPELVQDILRTHPLALLGDQLCPNVFYEPSEMVLDHPTSGERVDWMIARLRSARLNEQKLEEVNFRLSQSRAALARADRAKEDLLGMLAHELRNPLGTISNALQILRLQGEGDETWKRTLDAAERQVLHQALLVDELLEASRVTRGEVELNCEQLDLGRLVRETVEGYRETLRNSGLHLELELPEGPLPVHGDRLRLSQVLANLLRNAAKFTSPGGRVWVRAGRAAEGGRAEVTVRDDGVGIPPEVLPHVFEIFTQADRSLDRSAGGLGVGLAVVRGLVDMHGGEVEARSAGAGQGAELTLRLPLAAGAQVSRPAEAGLPAEPAGPLSAHEEARRILVVEDNPDAAATMRDFLELSGHQVALANNGTEGVQAARDFHPEVVLCDLGLPGMDGFQVAAALRSDPATASAKLIAVTGYGRDEDRRRSREAGFDVHLTKPVDPAQLKRVIQEEVPVATAPPEPVRQAGSSA